MKTIYENTALAFPVKLEMLHSGRFRVTYGQQIRTNLTYAEAAKELGECIMHALGCDGAFDPA